MNVTLQASSILSPYTHLALFLLALPVYIFLYLWLVPKKWVKSADWTASFAMAISFFMAIFILVKTWNSPAIWFSIPWFSIGNIHIDVGIYIGNIQALMVVLVTFISLMVHIYSIGYMKGDGHYNRYFAFLNLFTFSMLGIIFSDSLLQLFVFWELVGMSSYLLIGFYQRKDVAGKAAQKAFILNRIGDLGLLTAISLLFVQFGTFSIHDLHTLFSQSTIANGEWINGVVHHPQSYYYLVGFGLLLACIGKSAQFPLQVWLPDAMQGPTPVSALIHAATMVAAGVFLLFQCYSFLAPEVLITITCIGCLTAFLGAYAASGQSDIKKILAFSTISQLGFMVMALGVGTPENGIFHLVTHAFFKAALFLAAGSVIHALHDTMNRLHHEGLQIYFNPQHINVMGGLWKKMPFTAGIYLVATWGAAGLPLSSGFLSKDEILTSILAWSSIQASHGNWWAWAIPTLAFITTLLTAFYMTRQFLLIFAGESRLKNYLKIHYSDSLKHHPDAESRLENLLHVKDVSSNMQIPMGLLTLFTIWIFFSLNPIDASHAWIPTGLKSVIVSTLSESQQLAKNGLDGVVHSFHPVAIGISCSVILIGFLLSNWIYRTNPSQTIQQIKLNFFNSGHLLNRLAYNQFYLDRLYRNTLTPLSLFISTSLNRLDRNLNKIIDFLAIFTVVFGHTIAWIDKNIVDGFVLLPTKIIAKGGRMVQHTQSFSIQTFIVLAAAITGLAGFIWWIF
jgi:NADH-quinone oxidoreductase subunit L